MLPHLRAVEGVFESVRIVSDSTCSTAERTFSVSSSALCAAVPTCRATEPVGVSVTAWGEGAG